MTQDLMKKLFFALGLSVLVACCSRISSIKQEEHANKNDTVSSIGCSENASTKQDDHINRKDPISSIPSIGHITTERTIGLTLYFPHSYTIGFVCGTRPSETDSSIIYCAEAAFTGKCLNNFDHFNIAGNHVSNGKLYHGYPLKTNSGAFVYYNGKWKFLYSSYAGELKNAANNGGMGFGQNMIIYNGTAKKLLRKDKPLNIYRALCETKEGMLCIIESDSLLRYSDFVQRLSKIQVKHALYLDMGGGWNYSWYRDSLDHFHALHPKKSWSKYQTNWIVFRKSSK